MSFLDFGSGIIGGALAYRGARKANEMNRQLAREQMQFQERMSNTSYQRAMADMEKAGLNPILAFQQGGASSPGGASAAMQNEMAPAVSSGLDAMRAKAELANLRAQNKNLLSQNRNLEAETEYVKAQTRSAAWDPIIKQQQYEFNPINVISRIFGPLGKLFLKKR